MDAGAQLMDAGARHLRHFTRVGVYTWQSGRVGRPGNPAMAEMRKAATWQRRRRERGIRYFF
jgi:hypothetical protein